MGESEKEMLKNTAVAFANARRLIKDARMPNWVLYSELFDTGSRTAIQSVSILGLNPDSKKTSYTEMCDHINEGRE
jgi:hypothetical protein